ncbi:MAG: hypothetical protein ACRCZI_10670 [Cetobacterium sp.]
MDPDFRRDVVAFESDEFSVGEIIVEVQVLDVDACGAGSWG